MAKTARPPALIQLPDPWRVARFTSCADCGAPIIEAVSMDSRADYREQAFDYDEAKHQHRENPNSGEVGSSDDQAEGRQPAKAGRRASGRKGRSRKR